ncbi:MAG: M3 family oligoendopeptidase [Pseudomonadota bacterium]
MTDTALGKMPQWQLETFYPSPDSKDFKDDVLEAEKRAHAFQEKYQNNLQQLCQQAEQNQTFFQALKDYEDLQDRIGRIGSYSFLLYVRDTFHAEHTKFFGDMQEKLTNLGSKLLFFPLEINKIQDAILEKALQTGALQPYRYWFEDLRKGKPYQLDDKLEELFHEKHITGRAAWSRLFNNTMSALSFDVDGKTLNLEATLNHLSHKDNKTRKTAADALVQTFGQNIRLFTTITNTLAKDKEISDRWRGYQDIADSRHLANSVEREVVEALEKAVTDSYAKLSHRYYALKAKWLGMEKLAYWDRNAPLPESSDEIIDWTTAQETVLSAYNAFSPEIGGIVKQFFDNNWIDAPVSEGKSPGAFAHPTVPSAHPFIMLNYLGKPRDVMTLAHELGHGVHQYLANAQGPLLAPTPLTLAETASVFGEMLTFKTLLSQADTPEKRKAMLASKVEDMINTVIRQIAFYTFERKLHTARREGELTSEQIGTIWMSVQSDSLGPSVDLKEGYEMFWCYVPHFINSPFYVYAYAFGECLVNSLYAVYENSEDGFAQKYLDLLSAGGSKHHKDLLSPFGLNASDPGFWSMGLSVIERFIDELEEL